MVLGGDLRKQKPPLQAPRNEQAVATDFDLFGADWCRGGKQGNLDVEVGELVGAQRRESRILQRGAGRAAHDALAQRLLSLNDPDAAAQMILDVQSDEYTLVDGKSSLARYVLRKAAVAGRFGHRVPRQL